MSTPEPREAEIEGLRRRAAELTSALAARRRREEELRETEQRLTRLLEATNDLIAFSVDGAFVEVNQRLTDVFGYEAGEMIGRKITEIAAPESRDLIARIISSGSSEFFEVTCLRKDGERIMLEVSGRATFHRGRPARVAALRDVTAKRRAEELLRVTLVQREVIRAQEEILSELSTPLLPISEDILVLPLIGAVNADRAGRVVRALVEGVAQRRARTAILDITGVPFVSDHVADALCHAARAAQLLGARVILTGIRPEVAQRFILLGTDLSGIMTYGTLESGVAFALSQEASSRRPAP